ncbi:histone-lysine n-methyltransferase ASH1L [Fusarium mexicanum]|uniref:Histone-lysine n-methyltransferase ASH1L n=1 Tax=Fusarium mexicanum TaxID=751941 RepID=A0A8H5JPN6_9HYPO|nr:histone-lysine n-methyltransferase ASH1L [Fusarium mexicanum]
MALLLSSEGAFEVSTTDDSSSNVASATSTPPTTVADEASLHSDSPKRDVVHVALEPDSPEVAPTTSEPIEPTETDSAANAPSPTQIRSRRSRVSAPVYNLVQLSGTAGHGKRRAKGDIVADRRRRRKTISGPILGDDKGTSNAPQDGTPETVRSGIDALGATQSASKLDSPRARRQKIAEESSSSRRSSARRSSVFAPIAATPITKNSKATKRSRKSMEKPSTPMSRELRRLQDTKEFAHIDEKPVVLSVWSNGKFVDPKAARAASRKKAEPEQAAEEPKEAEPEPVINPRKRRVKKYLAKGLYAGQDAPIDISKGLTVGEKKALAQLPELIPSGRVNKTMPFPMFNGLRTLIEGRDFKLPYQVCNPLPPGQPKPDEWKKMTKNRFIGESRDYWRKSPHFHDYSSKCVCKPEDGCGESCQNRIMLYECDEQNCNAGKQYCTNRAFATLTARRNKGGKYRVGVEVIKTSDRGYGVRSNRCFRPNQIIMEYAGEIITEEECERRMTEVYKDNECYYLMSFDQNMIIDATTGSIARFVNHSCNPNCRMIKWIVSGQPRMALFAGDKPIMTGDELTYDYNFDPFSAKNVQKCLCGEPNCRGVLGPKPREVKQPKTDLKNAVKGAVKAGKRKLKELIGDEGDNGKNAKKRKVQPAKGVKRAISNAGSKMAKGAANAFKKGVSTVASTTKKAALGSKSPAKRRVTTGALLKKTTTKRVMQTYARTPQRRASERASSVGLVSASRAKSSSATKVLTKTTKTTASLRRTSSRVISPRQALDLSRDGEIRVVADD